MKTATVFEIKRFAIHDGDGIRTTVFFKGCPLKCVWCHNPEGISPKAEIGYYAHKCKNCGECVSVCPEKCHKIENGMHAFDREKCIACGKCTKICPQGIDIPQAMKGLTEALAKIPSWAEVCRQREEAQK